MRRPLIPPHRICRILGHRREGYNAGVYTDRRGRRRERWHLRCTRCGTSDGGEIYRQGLLEWVMRKLRRFREWHCTICHACGLPERRFGKSVGDHSGCIPF